MPRFFSVIIFLVSLTITGCIAGTAAYKTPSARDGILDLGAWDFEKHGIVNLKGEWDFYWNHLYTPEDFRNGEPERTGTLTLPGLWSSYTHNGRELPGRGYATFRLRIKVPDKQRSYGIKITEMESAYRLYVNGKKVAECGRVAASKEEMVHSWERKEAYFSSGSDTLDLVMQMSNFKHRKGGPEEVIKFGTGRDIVRFKLNRVMIEIFLVGSIFIMGIYHLILFFLRRREKSTLVFAVLCFLISLRTFLTGEKIFLTLFPFVGWDVAVRVEYIGLFLITPVMVVFLRQIFREHIPLLFVSIVTVLSALLCLTVLVTPAYIFTHTTVPFQIMSIAGGIYALYLLARASLKKVEGAFIIFIGLLFMFGSAIHDTLFNNLMIDTSDLTPVGLSIGVFVMVLSQSSYLAIRFSRAFRQTARLSKELAIKNRQLQRLDLLKDDFLARTSHELKTPLSGIIGLTESLMYGEAGNLSSETRYNLAMIASSGGRLTNLINDILDYSRLKNSELTLYRKPVDVKKAADTVIHMVRPLVGAKEVVIRNRISKKIPHLNCDENRLHQVLTNLLSNAVKFTDRGEITVSAETDRETVNDNDNRDVVRILVRDTGTGIPRERHDDIFLSFEQVESDEDVQRSGSGLGLTISKELVELHGGRIWVESEPGKGSSFYFTMPAYISGGAGLYLSSEKPDYIEIENDSPDDTHENLHEIDPYRLFSERQKEELLSVLRGIRVLVVDDEPVNLHIVREYLQLAEMDIETAVSPYEALGKITNGYRPDLMLVDVMMPKMNGFELVKKVREQYSMTELPVILFTAYDNDSHITEGFMSGANDYLTKPVSRRDLLSRVKNQIKLRNENARVHP